MTTNKSNLVKIFFVSSIVSTILLLIACFLWTDFAINEVANIMFWVGGLVMLLGVGVFYPNNPYQGQSEAYMTVLRDKQYVEKSLERNDRETTRRLLRGACIALPGVILIIASWLILIR